MLTNRTINRTQVAGYGVWAVLIIAGAFLVIANRATVVPATPEQTIKASTESDARMACYLAASHDAKYGSNSFMGAGVYTTWDNDAIVVRGEIELLNEFGAWLPHTYRCNYNITSKYPLVLSVEPGRMR